jgi:cyclophilin family peptidyl-prolyl cis-trans isomerase
LERNQRYLERDLYRDVDNFPINAHKDFGIDLAQLCPEVRSGGVFQVQYTDPYYEVRAKPVRVSKQSLPDLSQWIRLETNRGPIDLKLMAMEAPNHARNFAILVAEGFYQNMIWHRVVKDFVIQTGDPTGTGEHGSEFTLDLEWSPFAKHNAYAVGMARAQAKDSADSQFYICLTEIRRLNKDYTVFAQVVGGHKVVDAIGNAPTSGNQGEPPNKPFEDITLDRAYFIPSGTADHTQGD